MDNNPTPMGSSLSLAVDRLDRALEALEARVRALQNGDPLPADEYSPAGTAPAAAGEDYLRVLSELAAVRAEKDALAAVANDAFDALGDAAANIRILLREQAA